MYTPTSRIYFKGNTPNFFGGNRGGYGKVAFGTKAVISLRRSKIRPRLLLRTSIEVPYALLIGAEINDLG